MRHKIKIRPAVEGCEGRTLPSTFSAAAAAGGPSDEAVQAPWGGGDHAADSDDTDGDSQGGDSGGAQRGSWDDEWPSKGSHQAASSLAVTGAPASVAAGTSFDLTVTALTADGKVATRYTGTVHFSSADVQGVLPADYTFTAADAGTHTFSVALRTVGTGRPITVADPSSPGLAAQLTGLDVTPAEATEVLVAGFAGPVTAGAAQVFTVEAVNAFGNVATGYRGTIHLTSTDPLAALPADYTFVAADAGAHTFSAALNSPGAWDLAVADAYAAVAPGTPASVLVLPNPPGGSGGGTTGGGTTDGGTTDGGTTGGGTTGGGTTGGGTTGGGTTVPLSPTSLIVNSVSSTEVSLTWVLPGDPSGAIKVERQQGSNGPFSLLDTLGAGSDLYTDTSCYPSTTYTYRLVASNPAGDSAPSAGQSATTQPPVSGGLLDPTDLAATADTPTTATITWTDPNAAQGNRDYVVERSDNGVRYTVVGTTGPLATFQDSLLTPGATYSYRVRGVSTAVPSSNYTPPVAVTMPARAAGMPIEPSGTTAVVNSATSVTLSWRNNDPSDPAFVVERATYDPYHTMVFTTLGVTGPGATTFQDPTTAPESAYVYRVRATNAVGDSDPDAPVDVATASAGTGSPTTYDIGPGQPYPNIADLDWTKLGPGDTVNIHFKPGGYHELFLISTRGTADQGITINGVPDPATGQLPVIDGLQATLAPQFVNHYAPVDGDGDVVVGTRPGYAVGYKPGYITIQNLQFQGAYAGNTPNTFTDYDGSTRAYGNVGAGIYIERGDHVTISGCTITGNGEGIFAAGQSGFDRLMTDIVIRGNTLYGNGNVGSYLEHQTYIEAVNTTYEGNDYGPLRPGALGANLKDRSVNAIIRYNNIVGGAHLLDLVESQNQIDLALTMPAYHVTRVYGNVLVNPPGDGSSPVMYGGDQGVEPFERQGVLDFSNNTLVNRNDQTGPDGVYKLQVFQTPSGSDGIDARNNVFVNIPATAGQAASDLFLISSEATASFGRNWVSPGWQLSPYAFFYPFTGNANGTDQLIGNLQNDPGMVNLYGGDYHLTASSPLIDESLPVASDGALPLDGQYAAPHAVEPRPIHGSAPDLGAFESS